MKKIGFLVTLFAGVVLLAGTGPTVLPNSANSARGATGLGTIAFGHHDEGRAVFDFSVRIENGEPVGHAEVALEIHHDDDHSRFPALVVRMTEIESATIGKRKVKLSGHGVRHDDEEVSIELTAYDGAGTRRPDSLTIKIKAAHHAGILDDLGDVEVEGEVFIGDISIEIID